ncbi:hypothetical protein CDL12_07189 [Handroanthus impetiginosus]|uniref:Uncharacterized protein n=1 Tax=Handroanthus impetiginosus TaxID=429701 RepID=A0A2G9HRI4_9LAMI|nr:hypothetical protein CDL12_07189 [Handroanthus impetiginosus]
MKPRRSGEASSVGCYNLKKTRPVKEYYRCTEFDDYTPVEHCIKHGENENVISSSEKRTRRGAKRTRLLYLPENANSNSLKHSLSAEPTSSKSTECDSFGRKSQNHDGDQGVVKRNKLKLKVGLKAHNHQQNLNVDQNRDVKLGEYLAVELEDPCQSAFLGNGLEVISSYSETALVDVHLTVKANCRAENVPFVSLTSKYNGKAILGYPLEIRELGDGSETLHSSEESVARKLFDEEGSGFHRLVWRTSKRTPVCYVTNSLSSSIPKNGLASADVEYTSRPVRENYLLVNEQSFMKLVKNPKQDKLGKAAVSRTCVRVELIFSKLLAAIGQIQS